MTQAPERSSVAEALVDREAGPFSLRDLITSIFLRPKMFLFALLVPPIVAVLLSAMVPLEWSATAKILIRYSAADTSLLKDLLAESHLGLSGTTSAELIKSTPVLANTIRAVGITSADVYRKPMEVLSDRLSGLLGAAGPANAETGQAKAPANAETGQAKAPANAETGQAKGPASAPTTAGSTAQQELVKSFKESLEGSTKASTANKPIELLEKTSQVPESMKIDELITLEVKSFNREKVAAMTNGLAAAFIDEYYRLYSEEAQRQSAYIEDLLTRQQQQLKALENASEADFAAGRIPAIGGRELIARDVPVLTSMGTQLMDLESGLARARQIYASGSPEVVRLESQVARVRFALRKQERIEIGKALVEQLRTRSFQARNTESLYRDRLVPISVVEPAVTPRASGSKRIMRLAVSAVIGTALGALLSLSLMIVLNVTDPRIRLRRDLDRLSTLGVSAQVPRLRRRFDLGNWRTLGQEARIEDGMLQLLAQYGQKQADGRGTVITLCGPSHADGTTFCALALALTAAKNRALRVCLIDAHFGSADITRVCGRLDSAGLIDALLGMPGLIARREEALNLTIIGAGRRDRRNELGYYADHASTLLAQLRADFDCIVIDAGAVLRGSEPAIFGKLSDVCLLVVSSGITRKGMIQPALARLAQAQVVPAGLVLDCKRDVLPGFLYANV